MGIQERLEILERTMDDLWALAENEDVCLEEVLLSYDEQFPCE